MDFLGIGPFELLVIFLLALILFGPTDMVKAGRTLGKLLRSIVTSPTWQLIQQTSKDFRNLPNKLIRDAGLEEDMQQIKEMKKDVEGLKTVKPDLGLNDLEQDMNNTKQDLSAWTTPPTIASPPAPTLKKESISEQPSNAEDKTEE